MDKGAWQSPVHEVAELDMTEHSISIAFLLEYLSRAQVGESWCQMSSEAEKQVKDKCCILVFV